MEIIYFLNNEEYAGRTRDHIPRKEDCVRLKGVVYEISCIVWIEDDRKPYVAIYIMKEGK